MLRRLARKHRRLVASGEGPTALTVQPEPVAMPTTQAVQGLPPVDGSAGVGQSELAEISDLLRRLNQTMQASNVAQMRLAERLERQSECSSTPTEQASVPANFSELLAELPKAVKAASEIPVRTVNALDRIEAMASTIRSQQQLQQQASEDLSGMRQDLQKFLGTVAAAVSELTELHKAALDQCARMAQNQREVLHSHRMHAVELQRLHDRAKSELAEEHLARQQDQEYRARRVSRRISMAVAVLCVTTMLAALIAGGVIDLRAAFRSPQARAGQPSGAPIENQLKAGVGAEEVVDRGSDRDAG